MRYNIFFTAVLLNMMMFSTAFSHALWIETAGSGTIGKVQQVKIFYGEYAEKEFEETTKWYSDVNTFTLWLTAPDGAKEQLACTAVDKAFTASFTPAKEGVYILTVGHSAKDIAGTVVYQFNASATVEVKASGTGNVNAITNNELYLQPLNDNKNKGGIVKAFFKGKPAAKITITVSGPEGWSKNFETDENGVLQFDLLWKGWYALEGFYTTQEKGNINDKPYEKIWRCATVRVNYN